MISVWLDVDTGHDDAFGILLAAFASDLQLLGVTTVHGNAPLDHTTYNTRSVLEAIGRRDIPVYPGSSKPAFRDAVHAGSIHGETGLDGTTMLPKPVRPPVENADFIAAMYDALIATAPDSAWLVATGTLTNVARLFQEHPDLAGHLKGVSIMGGAIGSGFSDAPMGKIEGEGERFGNWTAFAEFNIYCDPESAQWIFSNPVLAPKTILIPLDVTHQVTAGVNVQDMLLWGSQSWKMKFKKHRATSFKNVPSPTEVKHFEYPPKTAKGEIMLPSSVRALFHEILTYFTETYATVFGLTDGPPLHDPLAVAAVFAWDLFHDEGTRYRVSVVTDGVHSLDPGGAGEMGRTVVKPLEKGEEGIRIPRGLDVAEFWMLVDEALEKAERVSPLPPVSDSWRPALL